MQFGLLYNQQQIQEVVKKMAVPINKHYAELLIKEENPHVVVICILKGAFMFFSDLSKHF
jgi:hypoxanthine phosphoribosyltransferase